MPKKIFFEREARERVLAGAEILYKAVKVTMSPRGRNVAIKRPYGHTITHDGVTVADMIQVDDMEKAVGADMIQEAAGKLNNEVGDGTTSVTVLTYNLLKEAMKLVDDGMNPSEIRAGLKLAQEFLLKQIDDYVVELDDKMLLDVAAISAGEKELGHIIGKLAAEIGKDGVITVEQGRGFKTETTIRDGFSFERGYLSPFFVTDKKRLEAVLTNPTIIICNEKLTTMGQANKLFEGLREESLKEVLLVVDDLAGDAMQQLVQTHVRQYMKLAVVKAPAFGDGRLPAIEDLAAVVGGKEVNGVYFGQAQKVIVTKERTTIIGGHSIEENIDKRIEAINHQLKETESDFEKEKLEARRANLRGKVATIKVGGATEAEIDEKKYRVDDAVAAVKAAQNGGVVAGGGVTLVNLAVDMSNAEFDMPIIVKSIIMRALKMPFTIITQNADLYEENLLKQVESMTGMGVDVTKGDKLIDLVPAGIIDPAKVTKQVLQAAFSIAMTAITIDVLVVDVPDEV